MRLCSFAHPHPLLHRHAPALDGAPGTPPTPAPTHPCVRACADGCWLQEVLVAMEQRARALARSVRYVGAATVEFLYCVDEQRYYFLELNPRLQVRAGGCAAAPLRLGLRLAWRALQALGVKRCRLRLLRLQLCPASAWEAPNRHLCVAGGYAMDVHGPLSAPFSACIKLFSPSPAVRPASHLPPPHPPPALRQVEHPVTEGITGVNIPATQLLIGMGIPLWRIPTIRALYNKASGARGETRAQGGGSAAAVAALRHGRPAVACSCVLQKLNGCRWCFPPIVRAAVGETGAVLPKQLSVCAQHN